MQSIGFRTYPFHRVDKNSNTLFFSHGHHIFRHLILSHGRLISPYFHETTAETNRVRFHENRIPPPLLQCHQKVRVVVSLQNEDYTFTYKSNL